ncbi:MAG: CD1247 N-terminal domain-containing protein [Oscillibacter sp.]
MGISEKVAYLKGLMEGMNLNADSNEGKLFLAIADVLDEIALEVEDLTDEVMELGDGLDVISDDLGDVEDIVYDEDEDDYEDEEDDEDDEEECYATTCPECEEEIFSTIPSSKTEGRVPSTAARPSSSTPPTLWKTRKRRTTKRLKTV